MGEKMKKLITTVCHEELKDKNNKIIGTREIINEFHETKVEVVCVTRGIVKCTDGRTLVNKVIAVNGVKKGKVQELNLLTGEITGGGAK